MTDLTFCYIHMSKNELYTVDTYETAEYIKGDLDDDVDLDIPLHMMPPNPDDSESSHISVLPSQVHPSYPYGNPTSAKHPVNKPRVAFDPTSRALFEDMGFVGVGINGTFRWNELALEQLLPIDEAKEEAKRAAQARKMASGAGGGGQQQQQPQQQHVPQPGADQTIDEDDAEDDEDEDDEDEDEEDGDEDEEDEEGVNSDEEEDLFGGLSDEEE